MYEIPVLTIGYSNVRVGFLASKGRPKYTIFKFMIEHEHFSKAKMHADIHEHGCSVIMVSPTDYMPSFAYTVGLWQNYQHPEVIMFGLPVDTMHVLLNNAADLVKSGSKLGLKQEYSDFFERGTARFIGVDARNVPDYFEIAIDHYGNDMFPAIQLLWADAQNIFPWQKEYDERLKFLQPLLDRNTEFKFLEDEFLGVYTTRQWLELKQPILRVVHDTEGDWQFLTGDQQPEDIRLVCLKDIIQSDFSLNQLFNLDFGMFADRTSPTSPWIRNQNNKVEE